MSREIWLVFRDVEYDQQYLATFSTEELAQAYVDRMRRGDRPGWPQRYAVVSDTIDVMATEG